MTASAGTDRIGATPNSDMAMLLLQLAASRAEIGPFARHARETPQAAARCYRAAASPAHDPRRRLV